MSRALRGWTAALKASAWLFGLGTILVAIMALNSALDWGLTDASNWGYALLAIFVGAGTMIVSMLVALVSSVVLLILRQRHANERDR